MRENEKPEGYDVAMYYTPETHAQNVQVIMSQVGDDTNWKMCLDTSIEADAEAKVGVENKMVELY